MDHESLRPWRTRSLISTIELCINSKAGENGALELIDSTMGNEHPAYYFWPLGEAKTLASDQLRDLQTVVGRIISENVYLRVQVQEELFKAL